MAFKRTSTNKNMSCWWLIYLFSQYWNAINSNFIGVSILTKCLSETILPILTMRLQKSTNMKKYTLLFATLLAMSGMSFGQIKNVGNALLTYIMGAVDPALFTQIINSVPGLKEQFGHWPEWNISVSNPGTKWKATFTCANFYCWPLMDS